MAGLPLSDIQPPDPGPQYTSPLTLTQPKFDETSVLHHGSAVKTAASGCPRTMSRNRNVTMQKLHLQTTKGPFFIHPLFLFYPSTVNPNINPCFLP